MIALWAGLREKKRKEKLIPRVWLFTCEADISEHGDLIQVMLCYVMDIPVAHGVTWLEGSKAVKGSDGRLVESIKLEVALGSVNKHVFFFYVLVFFVCSFRKVQYVYRNRCMR